MPYFDDELDKDDPNNPQAPQLAGATQVMGGQQGQGVAAPKGPSSSDKFQNLNSYLDANQGNQFGENFAGKVNQDVANAGTAQVQAKNQFQNLADQGAVGENKDLVKSAVANPTGFASNSDNVALFQAQKNAQYKGPSSFADSSDAYQKAAGATTKALDVADKAQTEGGRFALLDNYFGKPQYNQGEKSLDNLLISGNSNANQSIAQAQKNAQDQFQGFQQENKDLSNYAATKKGETEATRNNARSALGIDDSGNVLAAGTAGADKGALSSLYSGLQAKAATGASGFAQQQSDIQKALTANDLSTLTPEERDLLGLNNPLAPTTPGTVPGTKTGTFLPQKPQSVNTLNSPSVPNAFNTFGVDPSKYFNIEGSPTGFTTSTVASADDAARIQALSKLAEIDPSSFIDSTQVGTAPKNPAKGDLGGLYSAAQDAKRAQTQAILSAPGSGLPEFNSQFGNTLNGQLAAAQHDLEQIKANSKATPSFIQIAQNNYNKISQAFKAANQKIEAQSTHPNFKY